MDREKWGKEFESDGGGVCSVLVTYSDKEPYFMASEPCHFCMTGVAGLNIKYVYSSCRVYDESYRGDAEEYWEYLFDPKRSPYRKALENVDVLKYNGHTVAVGIQNNGSPNQLCVGVMIQARIPYEWPLRMIAYRAFRKAGYDVPHAMYLSEHFTSSDMTGKKLKKSIINGGWHSSFDANCISYDRFMNGEPDPAVVNFNNCWMNNTGKYDPITNMWGKPKKGVLEAFGNQKKFSGILASSFMRDNGSIYFDNGVAITDIDEAIDKIKAYPKENWL